MNRASVGSTLTNLYQRSATSLLEIRHQATGDSNRPEFNPVATGHPALLLQLGARQRQSRAEAYSNTVTHEVYCEDHDDLEIGCRIRETHRKAENGEWMLLPGIEQTTWTVLGKQRLVGMPEPHGQVRLDLNQVSPTR